jgi:hypothetical protein
MKWSGVEWFASNTFCQEREQSIILPKPHTYTHILYNLTSVYVSFVILLLLLVVMVVSSEKKHREEEEALFFCVQQFVGKQPILRVHE